MLVIEQMFDYPGAMSVAEERCRAALPAAAAIVPAQLLWPRPDRAVVYRRWLGAHADDPVQRATDLQDAAGALAELTDAGLLEVAAAAEQVASWAKAAQVRALAELDRRFEAEGAGEFTADQVAMRMRWGMRAGQARLHESAQLVDRLPCTLALLTAGDIDYPRARTVVAGTDALSADDARAVDAAIAAEAPQLTNAQLRDRVALEAAAVDAAASARRRAAGRRDRRVVPNPLDDGLAELIVTGPAEDVATIFTALDGLAHAGVKEHGGGIDAARFDALTRWAQSVLDDAAAGAAPEPGAGRWSGSRPHILLTMAASTLLGLDDRPCLLEGYGYLPASVARQIAERGGTLRRLLTDPVTGVVLGVDGHTYDAASALADSARLVPWRGLLPGPAPRSAPQDGDDDGPPGNDGFAPGPGPSSGPRPPAGAPPRGACGDPARQPGGEDYRPSRALDRLVRARYRTCTVPGCMRPAVRCDLDHILRWPDGPTCACNLQPLCRRHHRMKHSGGVVVRRLRDGTIEWTIRTGHVFSTRPPPALPVPLLARPGTGDPVDVAPEPPVPPGYDAARWGARALREMVRGLGEPAPLSPEADDDLGPPPF